jgi:predicted nucleotidyltransferase
MVSPTDALARLRALAGSGELDRFCEAHAIDLLVVFGSALDEDPIRPPQDLDLAVLASAQDRAWAWAGLVAELAELLASDAIDVMDLGRANPLARAEALTICLPVYESRPGLFAEQQMAAITERIETRWLRSLDLDALAR